jgi:hypothetical protein
MVNLKRWSYRMAMKITDEKFERKTHIYARGKGENAEVCLRITQDYEDTHFFNLEIKTAKEFRDFLTKAIEEAERRAVLPNDDV